MPLIFRCSNSLRASPVSPEVALIVTTYQKPRHLRLSLASIALQQGVDGKFELIVADDGSTDETFEVVKRFAATVDFPVTLTTHRHGTFQVAQSRNEAVAASTAPYLVFTDGDLILPPDFVRQHLQRRRSRRFFTGDCYRLTDTASAPIDEPMICGQAFRSLVSVEELFRVRKADRRARWNAMFRRHKELHLLSGNAGIWRADFERVNGFDENFRGWGGEDDDLGDRLHRIGVRGRSIMRWTCAYHMWHPRDVTAPVVWHEGGNMPYYRRSDRSIRCENGLVKLSVEQLPAAAEPASRESMAILPFAADIRHPASSADSELQRIAG